MRWRLEFVPLIVAAALSACGTSSSTAISSTSTAATETTSTTSTVASSTTAAPTTAVPASAAPTTGVPATAAPASSTTAAVPVGAVDSYIAATWGSSGPFYDNGGSEPDGSGCSPASDELPDGIWYVRLVSLEDQTLGIDLMCVYSDEAAFSRPDYGGGDRLYVNESTKVRFVPLGENPSFYFLTDWNLPDSQQYVPLTVVANAISDGPADGWLLVEGGHATEFWQPWDS
ncbi:MAG: hypothetical protein KDB16_09120 [Acidimicrobiales bacterium]|nr:hypothetical protein [Acidimicrobiales bacterium]